MIDWITNLLAWYRANQRVMPWRGHPDPYAVWVSEIMLQQTQVDTVRPYFTRFLETFPTLHALATATDEPLLKSWEGLGYYTRVRNLRKAAQKVVADYQGQLPQTAAELQTLPGIGAYTAAAIASIAFGEAIPVVDGNVARVFARHNQLDDDFKKEAPRRALAQWLTPHIIASHAPADFNQAMMELGALICTPRHPQCERCPLRTSCLSAQHGTQTGYPFIAPKKALPTRKRSVLLLYNTQGERLLAQHSGERLLAGFWELPEKKKVPFALKRLKRLGLYRQTFSHFHLQLTLYTAQPIDATTVTLPEQMVWAPPTTALPLTTATRKILAEYN